jgi:hypothetical protein
MRDAALIDEVVFVLNLTSVSKAALAVLLNQYLGPEREAAQRVCELACEAERLIEEEWGPWDHPTKLAQAIAAYRAVAKEE